MKIKREGTKKNGTKRAIDIRALDFNQKSKPISRNKLQPQNHVIY